MKLNIGQVSLATIQLQAWSEVGRYWSESNMEKKGTKFLGIIIGENQKPDEYTLFLYETSVMGFMSEHFFKKYIILALKVS